MINITPYTDYLTGVLTPPRLLHSMGVMDTMTELAGIYALDPDTALLTGLLHDAAKDLPEAHWQAIVIEAGIEIQHPYEQNNSLYLHGPVGAALVSKELGVHDPLLLEAIATHTFMGGGPNFDHALMWCLRFSDLLEPNRNWSQTPCMRDGMPMLRATVYAGQLAEAANLHTAMVIELFESQGFPVHPNHRRKLAGVGGRMTVEM